MPKRRYIRATGSTGYDKTGITFPVQEPVDWEVLLAGLKRPNPTWEHEHGWENQPEVLVFTASDEEARMVDERITEHPALRMRTLVRDRHWRAKPQSCAE